MRLLYEAGGVKTTILDDRMQRAPAFLFPSAREARDFRDWVNRNYESIKEAAEATTKTGRLLDTSCIPPAACSTRASTTRRATPPGRT